MPLTPRRLLDYVVERFGSVQIIAVREKLFPELSEDCWLLFCGRLSAVRLLRFVFTVLDRFEPSEAPPREAVRGFGARVASVLESSSSPVFTPPKTRANSIGGLPRTPSHCASEKSLRLESGT